MVLLSMTPAVVAAVVKYRELQGESESDQLDSESALAEPAVGKPISHAQIIDISKFLKEKSASSGKDDVPCHLNELLRGSFIYTPPPEPKPEPVCASSSVQNGKIAELMYTVDVRVQNSHGAPP